VKTVATIEARMGSTRLPGKVLKSLGDKPVIQHIVDRARRAKYIDDVVVATSVSAKDDILADYCRQNKITCFRGSEQDVLQRVLEAALSVNAHLICELMGDCPFIDPVLIDNTITTHLSHGNDYTSNFYPVNYLPMGFAVQVFPLSILKKVSELTSDPIDHVHVSCFIYHNPQLFKLGGATVGPELADSSLRFSLDTQADYHLIKSVYDGLSADNPEFGAIDVVAYVRENPDLRLINKEVRQKRIEQG
jgi:spore coat polysaccharide biosynthesis protein SpsF